MISHVRAHRGIAPGGNALQRDGVIASIAFRNFKALRNAQVELRPFNLVIGPNGSGKSSLIEALVRLRTLARLVADPSTGGPVAAARQGRPEIEFRFWPPYDDWRVALSCVSEDRCDSLQAVRNGPGPATHDWPVVRERLLTLRTFEFNHAVIGRAVPLDRETRLERDGANLAAVLARLHRESPEAFALWRAEVVAALPEYTDANLEEAGAGGVQLALSIEGERRPIPAEDLSQGTLYALALFALALDPAPPSVVCIEELDRGLHPRLLRLVRDALYRLSHPEASGLRRERVQVIATTYSPFLLDLFRDHPDEVIITEKRGQAAHFLRLSDRPDLPELMNGVSLGDLWYTGILGGVPEERS